MKWLNSLKPDDFPGDMQLVAKLCGVEVAVKLAEKMGSVRLYVIPIKRILAQKVERHIIENFRGNNHKELAIETGVSESYVYGVLMRKKVGRKQQSSPELRPKGDAGLTG